ncbi:hypothetical protein MLD38_026529 [Melastoma candidum]|uniref:Uncharacterized protein n=1 Tax=Melastoma candidum TaxID=119954 RepID=A0ACB9P5E5_9MYRT|nr:hypothetical protein MLD38_026529 [Melastoma candidum]
MQSSIASALCESGIALCSATVRDLARLAEDDDDGAILVEDCRVGNDMRRIALDALFPRPRKNSEDQIGFTTTSFLHREVLFAVLGMGRGGLTRCLRKKGSSPSIVRGLNVTLFLPCHPHMLQLHRC